MNSHLLCKRNHGFLRKYGDLSQMACGAFSIVEVRVTNIAGDEHSALARQRIETVCAIGNVLYSVYQAAPLAVRSFYQRRILSLR